MPAKQKMPLEELANLFIENGFNIVRTQKASGYSSRSGMRERLKQAKAEGLLPENFSFSNRENKASIAPIVEIIEKQKKAFARKKRVGSWRKPHVVQLNYQGPYMLILLGDEHVDDDGTDLESFEYWTSFLDADDRVYGLSLGDFSNNWLRFLGFLYGDQDVTDDEGFELVKHYMAKIGPHLLGSVGGTHDGWNKPVCVTCGTLTGIRGYR